MTYLPQAAPTFDPVNCGGPSIVCASGQDHFGANSLRRVLQTLLPGMRRSKVTVDRATDGLPVRRNSTTNRDSVARLNSALRRWSVECVTTPVAKPAAAAVMLLDEQTETHTQDSTADELSQSTTIEPPEPVAQNPEPDNVEKEMDEGEYNQTAPDREPKIGRLEDYYEILQISRNADLETIHRVYRIMALRFHPDNAKTGNLERFLLLKRAYSVLSDPGQRAEYDAAHLSLDTQPLPVFESKDFVYGIEGEMNRRLGVLSLLYHRRRLGEGTGGISVLELEKRMAFPREYLNFTLWYLRSKKFIMVEENSDYALTYEGVDFVEANSVSNHAIRQLLTAGTGAEHTASETTCDQGAGQSVSTAATASPKARMAKMSARHEARRRAERKRRMHSIA